jgi:hypothetical protein
MVRMTADFLFTSCANIFGNQTAVDALYDFEADVFVGDIITACSWIMSDILGCAPAWPRTQTQAAPSMATVLPQ